MDFNFTVIKNTEIKGSVIMRGLSEQDMEQVGMYGMVTIKNLMVIIGQRNRFNCIRHN